MPKEPFFKIVFRKSAVGCDEAWDTYAKLYGDWMKNAFLNQKKGKTQFLKALDALHKNNPKTAVQILDSELKTLCSTAEEKITWLFFMGIAHEAMEQYAKAFLYFIAASEYEQENAIIHKKLADCAYRESLFGFAECHYQEAIQLLKKDDSDNLSTLASLYASLASCFTMMHKYEEAETALLHAEKTALKTPKEQEAKTLLYAARGEYENAESAFEMFLKQKNIQEDAYLKKQIDSIRSGINEQFCTIPVENSEIKFFWRWFSNRLDTYLAVLDTDQTEDISKMTSEISARMKKVFPFVQCAIHISAYKDETYSIFVSDRYARALSEGLKNLFAEMPEKVKEKIRWIIIH